jgi:hypothetical protein
MARSEIIRVRPLAIAARTSSSQTNSRGSEVEDAEEAEDAEAPSAEAPSAEDAEAVIGWEVGSGRYPLEPRKASIRRVRASAVIPAVAARGAAGALSNRLAAGNTSYARRLILRRWRGEMLSEVMLPP